MVNQTRLPDRDQIAEFGDDDLIYVEKASGVNPTAYTSQKATYRQLRLSIEETDGLVDGSAAEPSLFFLDDADTGIYRASANTIGFTASGSSIGTWSPSALTLTTALTAPSLTLTSDLAITEGGTGASTASDARDNLGLTIGTDVQAWSDNLDDIAALSHADGNFIVSDGTDWTAESGATARASLGLGTLAALDTVDTAQIDNDAITLAKMDSGTAGNIITYDASGNPAVVATGTAGQVLTSNGAGSAPSMQTQSTIFSEEYDSGNQTITAAGSLTLAHGLSSTPKLYLPYLVCTTADGGYSVNDEIIAVAQPFDTANTPVASFVSLVPDSTNINVRFGADAITRMLRKDNGAIFTATNSSWKLVVRAWA